MQTNNNAESGPPIKTFSIIPSIIFTVLWLAAAVPLAFVFIFSGMAADSCSYIPVTSTVIWYTAFGSLWLLIIASWVGVWVYYYRQNKKKLIIFGFLPLVAIVLDMLFVLSLSVLGCS